MRNSYKKSSNRLQVLVTIISMALVSACSSMPPIKQQHTVALSAGYPSHINLKVDVHGDPEYSAGNMAAEGLVASVECGFLFFACAMVTVPLGVATGATITAIETLPEAQAHELNLVTADALASFDQSAVLEQALRDEAANRAVVLTSTDPDVRLEVVVSHLEWDVSIGNNVAMKLKLCVRGEVDGKRGERVFSITGIRAKTTAWTADSGALIRSQFEALMQKASQQIWQGILEVETLEVETLEVETLEVET